MALPRRPAREPVSGSSILVRRFFRLAYPGWQSFPCASRGRQRRPPISTDSLLEGDGFGLPVPSASHETVKPPWETGLLSRKRGADLVRNQRFESISLQRRVRNEPDPLAAGTPVNTPIGSVPPGYPSPRASAPLRVRLQSVV